MTPRQFKRARHDLGLTQAQFAKAVMVESGRTVRRWEAGDCKIPGPVERILELAAALPSFRVRLLSAARPQ